MYQKSCEETIIFTLNNIHSFIPQQLCTVQEKAHKINNDPDYKPYMAECKPAIFFHMMLLSFKFYLFVIWFSITYPSAVYYLISYAILSLLFSNSCKYKGSISIHSFTFLLPATSHANVPFKTIHLSIKM